MNNKISEIKITLEGITSRLDEERIKSVSWIQGRKKHTERARKGKNGAQKERMGVRELQDNMKCNNVCIIGIPEGETEEQRIEKL